MRCMSRSYIIHTDTRNVSFLQTAVDLRKLGVQNNTFFLRLYNERLRKIDPFSPFLTEEQIIWIINECMINPWYFLRECVRIPEQGGTGIPYQLHRANLAATFCFLNGIDHYLVIPRQKGKTQSTIATLLWAFLFGTTNSEFMFINKSQEDANNNLDRLKKQRELLPSYLQFRTLFDDETGKPLKEIDNVKSIYNPKLGNKIVAKPSASSIEKAENIGRGCTQPIQYYDEVEFTPFIKTIVEAAGPAFNTASRNAKRNNSAYCRIFTSTPGDLDTKPGQDALLIIEKTCKWTEKFYDWTKDEMEDYVAKNSGNGIVYIEYQYTQLGEDEDWFTRTCQTLLNNPVKIKREIFLQRMRGSSESPFEPEDLEALQELKGKVIEEHFINKHFRLDVYEKLQREKIYLVGVDVAHGLGKDNTAVTVVDPYTLKPVAEFKSPYIGTTDTTKFLYTLVRKFIPRAILCIERNNVGESVIDGLRNTELRANLYYDNTKDFIGIDDKLDPHGFLKIEAAKRKFYGVYTQGKSRDTMLSILDAHMRDYKDKFVTENIINDILSLVRKKNGKIEHAEGFHDDSLFSYLIALYVYYHGKNLSRYGFVRGQLPDEEERNKGLSYEDVLKELPEDIRSTFLPHIIDSQSQYDAKFAAEVQKARREMQMLDNILKPVDRVEEFDSDFGEGEIPLDFFDVLND